MSARNILVIDDERSIREFLTILLEQQNHVVTVADSVHTGITQLGQGSFDLVICDLKLPDGSGLEILEEARRRHIESKFIIITAHTTPQHALEALRAGAAEYVSKPFNVDDLKTIIAKLLASAGTDSGEIEVPEFVGESPQIRNLLSLVPRVAATPSSVLITGESGTGKELLARAIHAASSRSELPFVSVNCAAIPEGLIESELFGHARGSFTGAVRDHAGLFAQADSGTIFLDEVGELPSATQVKLLRVLQEHRFRPVGGQREVEVDVRVVAATNRDLQRDVEEGRFREDLYYRLNVIHLHLPALRQRQQDVPELARHFVSRTCERFAIEPKRLTADAIHVLQAYYWPGNVRELENIIERTVALEHADIISSGSLPVHLHSAAPDHGGVVNLPEDGIDLEEYLENQRRALMQQALERTGGQQKQAAELLRLSYRAFRYHADKLGLSKEEDPST